MIELKNLTKIYPTKERDFVALNDVSLTFEKGEFIAILGESGSGKTTFLNMISGIDIKTSGKIMFDDEDADTFSDLKWRQLRNDQIGFIFQRFNLIDHLTVIENVVLPLILTGTDRSVAEQLALNILKEVELEGIETKLAKDLSGGQRQRVAIARAIIIDPLVILADEPTGALDSSTALSIMKLLQKFAAGRIIILVTHDEQLAYDNASRVIRLADGEVISDEIIGERNESSHQHDDLFTYETKVTRHIRQQFDKAYPNKKGSLIIGETSRIPFLRDYKVDNPKFTRQVARKNYKQKQKVNNRILLSFLISIALLLIVNLVITNIASYNFNLFNVNNNYSQYLVTDFEDGETVISYLEDRDDIDEVSYYYELFVQEMYLDTGVLNPITSNVNAVNQGVFSPKLVTLPENEKNYYLSSQIIAGDYPSDLNEVIVSSEFLLTRFLGFSMNAAYNESVELPINDLEQLVGTSLYVCGETLLNEDDSQLDTLVPSECYEFTISGILNSYYNGIDYVGHIFLQQGAFERYIEYLRVEKFFTRVDEYYEKMVSFYPVNVDEQLDLEDIEAAISGTIINEEYTLYLETSNLRTLLIYVNVIIFTSLILISGTIDINIVSASVRSRVREIGIYSCIGVSKKSIRNMFVFETIENAIRIVLFNGALIALVNVFFWFIYRVVVVDLTAFEPIFGVNNMYSYELLVSIEILLGAILFLFVSVLVPSNKAANMRAIDALRG